MFLEEPEDGPFAREDGDVRAGLQVGNHDINLKNIFEKKTISTNCVHIY